jgi:hypothetical protein
LSSSSFSLIVVALQILKIGVLIKFVDSIADPSELINVCFVIGLLQSSITSVYRITFISTMGKASTCLVCILRENYDLYEKFYPVQGYCPHSKTYFSHTPHYKFSRKCLVPNIIITLFCVAPLVSYSIYLPEVCRHDKSLCVIFVADEIYIICCIILSLILFVKLKSQQCELNFWSFLFDNPEMYHLGPIMSRRAIKKFRIYKSVTFLFIFLIHFITGLLYFYTPYDYLPGSVLRRVSIVASYCYYGYGAWEISQRIKILGVVLKACEKSFVTVLCDKLSTRTNSTFRNYYSLINLINLNTSVMMDYMATVLVMWIFTSVVSLIFNIYILIDFYDYGLCTLSILGARTLVTILQMLLVLVIAERKVNKKVSFPLHI